MHSLSGAGLATNYMAWTGSPTDSTGSGSMINFGFLYENTLSGIQGNAPGSVPEVTVSVFGLLADSKLNLPAASTLHQYSILAQSEIKQFKYGADVTLQATTWFAFMLRFDVVNYDLGNPGYVFAAFTPRVIFSSHFLSSERIYLQYSRYFYGDNMNAQSAVALGRAARGGSQRPAAGPVFGHDARPERHQAPGRDRLLSMASDGAPQTWEERWHPLRDEWVIVAAHRQQRPWTGETVAPATTRPVRHDPRCHLCPGNMRVSGARNADYTGTFVFDNDHPCVGPDAPEAITPPAPYQARRATGIARVVCFSPRHDLTLAEMSTSAIGEVVEVWRRETRDLCLRPEVEHVLCFENKGEVVGVSNPHPHGQIYATNFVFRTVEVELAASIRHRDRDRTRVVRRRDSRRAAGRPADSLRGRAGDRLRPLFRALRLRGLCRAQAARPPRVRARRRRGGVAGGGAPGRDGALRQSVADLVSVRDGAAPGASEVGGWRR